MLSLLENFLVSFPLIIANDSGFFDLPMELNFSSSNIHLNCAVLSKTPCSADMKVTHPILPEVCSAWH